MFGSQQQPYQILGIGQLQSPRILTPRRAQRRRNQTRWNMIKKLLMDILVVAAGNLISGIVCIILFEVIYNS